jgi:hypothetical protein
MIARLPHAAAAMLLLAGCAQQGQFPSLARRPAEDIDMSVEPVREAPVVPVNETLRARIEQLTEALRNGERRFEGDHADAASAARAAGPRGSESWVAAQQAISRLEASRAQTTAALADLHQLRLERADLPTGEEDQAALDTAIAFGDRIAAQQQARIDGLRRD